MVPETLEVTIDEAFRSVGEFGRGQMWLALLISLFWLPGAWQIMIVIFSEQDPIQQHLWRCQQDTDKYCSYLSNCNDKDCKETLNKDFCAMKQQRWEWIAEDHSILSDFDLQCEAYWAQISQALFFAGFLVGCGFFGWIADKYGRKRAMLLSLIVSSTFGMLTAVAPSIYWYGILRFLTGFGNSGIGIIAVTWLTELVGLSWRGWVGISTMYFFTIGECLMPVIAILLPNWRIMNFVCGLGVLLTILIWPHIPESPRWLLIQGRKGEATAILAAIAASNQTHLPEYPLQNISPQTNDHGLRDILKHKILRRRLLILVYIWCVVSVCYYGISLGLGALSGSLYLNVFLTSTIEFPAYFMACILIDRIGRRSTFSWCLIEGGAACTVCGLISGWGQRSAAILGKFGAAAAFNMAFLYTAELFPTVVRNVALGTGGQSARLGGIMAPLVIAAGNSLSVQWVPFILFGGTTLLAGLLGMTLPETLGTALPETIQEVQLTTGKWFPWLKKNKKGTFEKLEDSDDPTQ
eukprot:TRINITY_DN4101_c0_g1_i10.p1 TRINITY_DN4101_c0_g1~~TRINITY_DN4101_c0_g1_i10.p1  ORF type:complete len:522 (-),score=40.31 TRINITY_DN4101_c0_g1_i10:308-1873(-)